MNEHTFTNNLYAHIFTNCKNENCKVHPKYNSKKNASSPIFGKHDIKEQEWQGGMMFFQVN